MMETGRLQLAPDWTPSLKATQATLAKLGVKTEAMTQDDMRKRYPQMTSHLLCAGHLTTMPAAWRVDNCRWTTSNCTSSRTQPMATCVVR